MEIKMQKEEQKNYLSAGELIRFGIDCIDETVTFRSLKSEQQEEVSFSSLGISFKSGELSVLSSKNVVDNSVFAFNLLNDVSVKQGLPTAYFSIGSIDYENIVYNLLAMNTKLHLGKIRGAHIDMEDFEKIKEAAGSLYNANFSVFYSEKISPKEYATTVRKIYSENKIKFLIIDIDTDDLMFNTPEQIKDLILKSRKFSEELNIPILLSLEEKDRKKLKKLLSMVTTQSIFLTRDQKRVDYASPIINSQIQIVRGKEKIVCKLKYNTCTRVVGLD